MKILKQLLYFLTTSEKKRAGLLLIMTLVMAIIDMLGIASILPFMAVVTNPSIVETNFLLSTIFEKSSVIGVTSNLEFIYFLGFLVFVFLVFSISFKALTIYIKAHFLQMVGYSISKNLFQTYLNQPYSWFLDRNSADLGKNILSEVGLVLNQGLTPMFNLITQSTIIVFILFFLLLVNFKLTLSVIIVIGGSYYLIFSFFRKYLYGIGEKRLIANRLRFKFLSEAFGASKEVKLAGLEKIFINKFSTPSLIFAKSQANSNVISTLPRYFIEAVLFGGMLSLILFIIAKTGNFTDSIPIIAVYAYAGYRIMPSVQQIYQDNSILRYSSATIDKIYYDFKSLKVNNSIQNENTLSLNKAITLNQISYNYPNSKRTTLKDISLTIPAKTKVGFIGPTGCGKTTTIDIILGLLEPQKGTLEIDGEVINNYNRRSWQRSIGYVPQHIYLSDDTIAANIAFGVDSKNINQDMIEKSSKIVNLHKFVFDELPNQYHTIIGERGVRLSGGQRQRIGIARALYHNPKVLILDEATSALDNETEKLIIDAMDNLDKNMTVIIIAHRLNTIKDCDIVFKLDNGKLIN